MGITKLFDHKTKPVELILSLLLDSDHVAGACWYLDAKAQAQILHAVARKVAADSWEERIRAADQVIVALEEKANSDDLHKVIFGLPAAYLDADGNILGSVKPELKKLTKELELKAIGFVPVHQAIIYKFKSEENVPQSAILIGLYRDSMSIALYKIGNLTNVQVIPRTGDAVDGIERTLRGLTDIEVLPPRILLHGSDQNGLEELKSHLTNHPWTTRANFLHFPKIEILKPDVPIVSVSLAGASELSVSMSGDEQTQEDETDPQLHERRQAGQPGIPSVTEAVAAELKTGEPEKTEARSAGQDKKDTESGGNENDGDDEGVDAETEDEAEDGDEPTEDDNPKDTDVSAEESNVRLVTPEEFGFKTRSDVTINDGPLFPKGKINATEKLKPVDQPVSPGPVGIREDLSKRSRLPAVSPKISLDKIRDSLGYLTSFTKSIRGVLLPVIGITAVLAAVLIYWLGMVVLPKSTVTLEIVPRQLQASASAVIDPTVDSVSPDTGTIPGKQLEKSISGDKTIPATGKKQIGDPARGDVTIYNKSTDGAKTFKKGLVLTSGSFQFTLDGDVTVSSASENISEGSVTYGKATGSITASVIGPDSNLPSGSDFKFQNISANDASARNDSNLTGGTSHAVTVVSRDDYNSLVTAVSKDLVDKAKQEIAAGVSGGQKLIDDTIKTTVSDKKFDQELDQEASSLHGTVTLSVTGITYGDNDLKSILETAVKPDIPAGYTESADKTQVSVTKTLIKKNGTITVDASLTGQAMPNLNESDIKNRIAGKSGSDAEALLKRLPGVGSVSVKFGASLLGNMIPKNINNIRIILSGKQ